MSEEWGPWIEHDGRGCPCLGMYVRIEWPDGEFLDGIAGSNGGYSWDWSNSDWADPVIRYRIRKPRGLEALQKIAREVERQDA